MKKIISTMMLVVGFASLCQAYYVHVNGPSYTCPNSELNYSYSTNSPAGTLKFTITNGKIFNTIAQTWVTYWEFNQDTNPTLNESYPFRVKWDNLALGTVGNIKCVISLIFSPEGNKSVIFGSSPDMPVIAGSGSLLNCINEQQAYTVTVLPLNWYLSNWNYSNQIQPVSTGINTVTIKGANTTYSGGETLTGVFQFTTDGNTCDTRYVNKSVWVGKPSPGSQTVDGSSYYSGFQICPGSHWVGISWNGAVSSTSWQVWTGGSYFTTNTTCDFVFPTSASSAMISVSATNTCGTSYNTSYYLNKKTWGCGSFLVASYPNPASSELIIDSSFASEIDGTPRTVVPDEVILFDQQNSKVAVGVLDDSKTKIDTRKLPKGQYYLHVRFGEEIIRKHIIIER